MGMNAKRLYCCLIAIILQVTLTSCSSGDAGKMAEKSKMTEKSRMTEKSGIVGKGRVIERRIKNNVYIEGENFGGLKESEALKKLGEYAGRVDTEVKNAVFDNGSWEVTQAERTGRRVDIQKTLDALLKSSEGSSVKPVVVETAPEITLKELESGIVEIGFASTPVIDKQESRVNNIGLAAQKLNNRILAPGEEFSFNRVLGKRTEAKGYEEAPIIIQTEDGPVKGSGVGGGVCQLSTTLYNAVNKGGLTVTERHIHSKNVGYVPKGKDATVAYGAADFKFVNNRKYPVMIKTNLTGNKLTARILENRS